jgi:hypothetical protein
MITQDKTTRQNIDPSIQCMHLQVPGYVSGINKSDDYHIYMYSASIGNLYIRPHARTYMPNIHSIHASIQNNLMDVSNIHIGHTYQISIQDPRFIYPYITFIRKCIRTYLQHMCCIDISACLNSLTRQL